MSEAMPATAELPREERGMRVRHLAGVLKRRALIIAACLVLIPAAVYLFAALQPKQYRAAVLVQPGPLIPSEVIVSPSQVPPGWFVSPSASFVALLAKTEPVRVEAGRELNRSAARIGSVDAVEHKKTG